MSAVALGIPRDLAAQSTVNRRLDGKFEGRSSLNTGDRKISTMEGLDLNLTASIAYDDNIFQSSENESASLVVQVEPSIGWTAGRRDNTWVRLAYEGAGFLYLSEEDGNRIDHRLRAEGAVQFDVVRLTYSVSWARLGSPSADVGGESDRNEFSGQVALIYQPKGKVSYEIGLDRAVVDQVESGLFDFFQSSAAVTARYRHSRKTELEAGYRIGFVEIDGSGDQVFHQIGGGVSWSPRSKFNVSLQGGIEYRDFETGSATNPYLSARLNWNPRPKTSLFGEVYRRQEASSAVQGENFNLTGIRLGINEVLRDGWSANLEVGRESIDYVATSDEPASGREDTILFFRPSLSYAFSKDSVLTFLYQYSENDSTATDFGFENHQLGVSVTHRF